MNLGAGDDWEEQDWEPLLSRIDDDRCIPFLGAGANAGVRTGVGSVSGAAGGVDVAVPVGGIQTRGLPSAEVTVGATDVTGVRIVVPARHP